MTTKREEVSLQCGWGVDPEETMQSKEALQPTSLIKVPYVTTIDRYIKLT